VKTQKSHIENKAGEKSRDNPFIKMIEDKKRIAEAIRNGKDLSTLKGINFVSPISSSR
jgi:hypothetical protein